ncbi:MAG: ribonuclease HII [Bacteriovorax sp.]|nr:ribonuclease HII [Bacteriovorax sp.]
MDKIKMVDIGFFKLNAQIYGNEFFIAGCDEVGRGPLAGPVVTACASIEIKKYDEKELKSLLLKWKKIGITDSKKLTSDARLKILKQLSMTSLKANLIHTSIHSENITIKILIKEIPASTIDEINILQASLVGMKRAMLESCPLNLPGTILIDGNKKIQYEDSKHQLEAIIQGDSKSLLIGLASIAAKEYRDQLMKNLGEKYPGYGWEHNAGYPTKMHLEAIGLLGVTEMHRLTYKGVKEIYEERGYSRIE